MGELSMKTVFHDINLRDFDDITELDDDINHGFDELDQTHDERTSSSQAAASGDEWDTDLEDEGYRPVRRDVGTDQASRQLYLAACKFLHIVPANCFIKGTNGHTINLNFQGLGPQGVKAVATALVIDKTCTSLHLAGNYIGRDGIRYICEMMKENIYLTHLDLSENDLDGYAAKTIADIFLENDTLTSLNLSGNKFKGQDAEYIAKILTMARSSGVRSLDLSHNEFGDLGATIIGHALADNETVVYLSLAWNQIRKPGISCLSKGLAENASLKTLDLSNNGVDNDGAEAIANALTHNLVLEDINLNSNRIGVVGLTHLFNALGKNDSLKSLRLTNNPITRHGPVTALTVLQNNNNTALQEFEIADACVPREFNSLLEDVCASRPNFRVLSGGFMNSKDMVNAEVKVTQDNWMKDPVLVFIKFVEERKYKILDMFKTFDKDKSCTLSPVEFKTGLLRIGCALSDSQLNELIKTLDIDRSGEIDIEEFLDGFDKHKRRLQKYMAGSRTNSRVSSAASKRASSRQASRPSSSVKLQVGGGDQLSAQTDEKENTESREAANGSLETVIKQSDTPPSTVPHSNIDTPLRQSNTSNQLTVTQSKTL